MTVQETGRRPSAAKPDAVLESGSPIEHLSFMKRLSKHLSDPLQTTYGDIPLLICCFISGLVDSTVFNAFGTLVSMQTGNTIFLGLGLATFHNTTHPYGWVKSMLSIVCFALGCFCLSRVSRYLGPLKRRTLVASFLFQCTVILVTGGLVQGGVVQGRLSRIGDDIDWRQLLPICLLSFQAAGQIVEARALNYPEIPTVVITSLLHDLFADPELFGSLKNHPKRNRRVLGFTAILIGGVVSGFVAESTGQMQVPLWMAGGLKFCIAVAWMIWPGRNENGVK